MCSGKRGRDLGRRELRPRGMVTEQEGHTDSGLADTGM